MSKTLQEWKGSIRKEIRYVGVKPYSHNIISICLNAIAKEFGNEEANDTIDKLNLGKLGWRKVKSE